MKFPLISVIIPVYNSEKYLKRCLDSLLKQDYRNLEVIVIDDGSTDRSGIILSEYEKKFPQIRVLQQENQGVSSARNYGMKKAQGEYICFVDSDDYVFEDYVSYLYEILSASNGDCAICNVYKLSEGEDYCRDSAQAEVSVYQKQEALEKFFYRKGITSYSYLKLIRSELVRDIEFPLDVKYGEDAIFTYRLLEACETIVYSSRVLYLYYQHIEGVTHQSNWEAFAHSWKALQAEVLNKAEQNYPNIKNAVQSKGFMLALNFYCRILRINESDIFRKELKEYIKDVRYTVFADTSNSKIGRFLGGLSCISVNGLGVIAILTLKLNEHVRFLKRPQ